MIIPDKKRAMMTIMSKRSPQGESLSGPAPMKPEISKTEPGEPDGLHAASEDMMAAMHEKSPQKFMEALSNFLELHKMRPEKAEEQE